MSSYGPDLRLLFPSFDLKLAEILNATLNVPQEACNHICEVLIIAGATTWNHFICDIYEYAYIVDEYGSELKYQAQTDPRSTSSLHKKNRCNQSEPPQPIRQQIIERSTTADDR
eukprot:jgi/Psemu1/33659/gm1.33659_g